jgi:REP element-mobilizing transposase RayT
MENTNQSSSHAVFNIKLHIVFVTKYRRKTLTPELLDYLKEAFADCLAAWRCTLVEFGGEPDHVHLLIDIHPALDISVLINNLKTASARRAATALPNISRRSTRNRCSGTGPTSSAVSAAQPWKPYGPTSMHREPKSARKAAAKA